MTERKRKAGRPAGSKTAERPAQVVQIIRQRCPRCGQTEKPKALRNKRRIEGGGTFEGRQYAAAVIYFAECGSCGGPLVVRELEFVGE